MDVPDREGKIHSGGSGGIDNSNTQRESKHVEVPIECRAYKDGRTRDDQRSLSPVNHRMQMLEHYQQELFNRQNAMDRWVYERLYSSNKDQNKSADEDRKKEQKSGDGDKCEEEDKQVRRKKEFVAKTSSSSESDRRDRFVTDRRKKVTKIKTDRSTSEYESDSDRDVRMRDSVNLDVRSDSRHSERSSNRFDRDTPRITSTKERPRDRKSRERSQVYSRERNEVREDSRKLFNPDDRDQRVKSDRRRTSGYHSMNVKQC